MGLPVSTQNASIPHRRNRSLTSALPEYPCVPHGCRMIHALLQRVAFIVERCDGPGLRIERFERARFKCEEVVAQPSAFGEIQEDLILLGLVETFQVKFEFYDEWTHRSTAETGFFTPLFDCHVLLFTFQIVHNSLYHFELL